MDEVMKLDEKALKAAHNTYERYGTTGDLRVEPMPNEAMSAIIIAYLAAIKSRPRPSEEAVEAAAQSIAQKVAEWYDGGPILTTHIPADIIAKSLRRFAALSAIPHTGGVSEPGAIRICPMRDGPCQHGLDCPYVGDGPYGYPCKEGWRSTLSGDA